MRSWNQLAAQAMLYHAGQRAFVSVLLGRPTDGKVCGGIGRGSKKKDSKDMERQKEQLESKVLPHEKSLQYGRF